MYDYIIIGGGIAGLYMNYLLKNNKTLLLEKNSYLGGRAIEENFHNTTIRLGAGIGALHNKHLLKILKKLKIKYKMYNADTNLLFNTKFNMKKATRKIIKIYKNEKMKNNNDIYTLNVKQFIVKYISEHFFNNYNKQTEYKDYIKSNIDYYVKYYPIKDNIPEPYILVEIKWTDLINKLHKNLIHHKKEILLNYEVKYIKVNKKNNLYIINDKYETKNIIFATTVNCLQTILNKSKSSINININYHKYLGNIL